MRHKRNCAGRLPVSVFLGPSGPMLACADCGALDYPPPESHITEALDANGRVTIGRKDNLK